MQISSAPVNTQTNVATRFVNSENVSRTEIVSLVNGEAVTTTLAIPVGCEVDHASVIKLDRTYQADLEEFGPLGFEIHVAKRAQGGGSPTEYAVLNEQQSTLIANRQKLIVVSMFRNCSKGVLILHPTYGAGKARRFLIRSAGTVLLT
jgi:hypothetical protein